MIRALNLYAGIGGNRLLWDDVKVTAVEIDADIAADYQTRFPKDTMVIGDAHDYLLKHFKEFDFIWSSPPCPTHSRLVRTHKVKRYPDLRLYEEIIFLQTFARGLWLIENVVPYYPLLVKGARQVGRHLFWSNFDFTVTARRHLRIDYALKGTIQKWLGLASLPNVPKSCQHKVLKNAVDPKIGEQIIQYVKAAHENKPIKTGFGL